VYKVLICGDRDWVNLRAIDREVRKLVELHGSTDLLIIEGGAQGADQTAAFAARERSVHVAEVKVLWGTRHRRSAGPQRNAVMLSLEPDEVFAFHVDIEHSRGTKHMVRIARKAGIPVTIFER
jgi:hypothetical protein